MEAKQFYLYIGNQKIEAFLYNTFFDCRAQSSPLHSHRFTEIHFTECGECHFLISGTDLVSEAGTVTVIPPNTPHRLKTTDANIVHYAFQINYPVASTLQQKFPISLMTELGTMIRAYSQAKNFYPIITYLTFLCKNVVTARVELSNINNREFLIREFFENRYHENVRLADLAAELRVCEKQCARLVEQYMEKSFSKVLTDYRLNAAAHLLSNDPSLTASEIAELVGYRSYSGFWKAFKKMQPNHS